MASRMPEMNWSHEPIAESFRAFKARMNLFLMDNNITDTTKQAIKIKIALGDEGMRRILASGLSETEENSPQELWNLIESQVDASVKINFRVHRLEFSTIRQKSGESICDFVSQLRSKAAKCEFTKEELNERLIEMIILSSPYEEFRKELLTKPQAYPISSVIERGREYEAIQASQASLKNMHLSMSPQVDAIHRTRKCGNCGKVHKPKSCPAFRDECHGCGRKGHWKEFCRKRNDGNWKPKRNDGNWKPKREGSKKTHELNIEDHQTFYSLKISKLALDHINTEESFITMDIQHNHPYVNGPLKLKVDTGSGGNTLPLRTYHQMFHNTPYDKVLQQEINTKLTSYSGDNISCLGSLRLQLKKSNRKEYSSAKFYVVDVPGPAIIGLPTCRAMNIVTIQTDSLQKRTIDDVQKRPVNTISDLQNKYPDCFDGIGCFAGQEKLYLSKDMTPHVDAPRRCPIHLQEKIKQELDNMMEQEIIQKVDGHTDWCSSLTYATKKDGSLRICLDPRQLNKALKRCPHKIPTVEEITPKFHGASYFSKLDAKAGYWSVQLAPECQELTTFHTPFGKYCFRRLPFGLNVSQDIFQRHMDKITSKCEGCVGISDDIVVFGKTAEEHDRRLDNFMKVAREEGLMLNSKKCRIKERQFSFFGRLYSEDGVKPDPQKVEDIANMPSPENKQDLQRFLGMVTFLGNHITNLSEITASLRELTKQESVFEWNESYEKAYNELKHQVTSCMCLKYFNPQAETVLEVDASLKGLGAAILQNDVPVAFASKTLTDTQSRYSNIERECLAVVYGIQRFHHYLFGKHFTVNTDHKPLEMILMKPIHRAPPRLQRMITQIQGYNFTIKYKPGNSMILSDTLSRSPNKQKNGEIKLDVRVDSMTLLEFDLMNFSTDKQNQIRQLTQEDATLHLLSQMIFSGWPDSIKETPTTLREYWNFRDELAVENGVIFKGRQVVIPDPLRQDILRQLHISHQGIEKTRLLARETVYWPRINHDIEVVCKTCQLCQEMLPQQQKEPQKMHEKPAGPWLKLGTDLFDLNGATYIIIADYFSRYPIIKRLNSTKSKDIVSFTKAIIGLFGCPREIVSDNGPQFLGEYNDFCKEWGITHTTSSPRHAKSNGFIERQIRYIKPVIKKCIASGNDPNVAMLNIRATPIDSHLQSPAELLFNRPVPTILPSRSSTSIYEPKVKYMEKLAASQKLYADQTTKTLPQMLPGQKVNVWDENKSAWTPAEVGKRVGERSYTVQRENGSCVRRNRILIREKPETPPKPAPPANDPGLPHRTQDESEYRTRAGRPIKTPERYKE